MSKRVRNFSYIRSIACIAIVLLHTVFMSIGLYGASLSNSQIVFYRAIVNNLMWAVPLFVMVTGALLLNSNRKVGYGKLWKNYIFRIFLAIVIFGAIFSLCDTLTGDYGAIGVKTFLEQFKEVFSGTSWSHMWYLYCLIGLYLLLPAYKKIADQSTENDLRYLLAVYLIFISGIPILKIWNIDCGFYIHVSTIYPFYFFCGHYLWMYKEKIAQGYMRVIPYFVLVVSTAGLIILNYFRWSRGIEELDLMFTYSSICVVLQATSLYLILLKVGELGIFGKVLEIIDRYGFGVYLIHMIFLRYLLKNLEFNPLSHGGIWCMLGIAALVFVLSWVLALILNKIPLFNKII